MPDIFDEVDEDLRAERARRFFARYGGALAALCVAAVAATAGYEVWQRHHARDVERTSDQFVAAMRAAGAAQPDRAAVEQQFAAVAKDGGDGYRTLARLREAALKADGGDLPGASALWDAVASDASADPLLRDLANLQWAEHYIDAGEPAQVDARLKPLAAPDNAWHALAEEAQAMLALREGKPDAARDTLKQLAQDAKAPDGVRGRANGLLSRLGGS